MKKIISTILLSATISTAWAVEKQTYLDPSVLPEGFVCFMERYDVCEPLLSNGNISNMRNVNHTQKDIKLTWDPTYVNASGSYGRLYIENFFTNDTLRSNCNLEFSNVDNRNFKWSDDGKQLMFSFRSVEIGPIISVSGWTYFKTAYVASAKTGSSEYFAYPYRPNAIFNKNAAYGYDGGYDVNFTYDLETKTITTSSVWGIFIGSGSGSSPGTTRVFYFYTSSTFHCVCTDLVDIINDEEISVGDGVTVADDLLGVKVVDEYDNDGQLVRQVLFAKDMNKYATPDVKPDGAIDYMKSSGTFSNEYDQSNWVVLTFDRLDDTGKQAVMGLEGYVIKGGTVKGTLTDKTNPAIDLSEAPVACTAQSYYGNTYVVPSFNEAYAAEGSRYFFVRPKPQEWCIVQWATYDAATNAFYVPAMTEHANTANLSGGVAWGNKYLASGNEAEDQTVYIFPAIVTVVEQPETPQDGPRRETAGPKVEPVSTRYQVMPLELSANSVVTAVSDVQAAKAVEQTIYYNVAGMGSATPFKGLNMVVTRFADGTKSVAKVIF